MRPYGKLIAAAAIILAGVAAFAPSPGASSEHFVILNNSDLSGNNFGTVLKLAGTKQNAVLNEAASLATGVSVTGSGLLPTVQVVRAGANTCVFLADGTYKIPNEISAFKYPGMTLVGNYSDSNVPDIYPAEAIAAGGGYLYATYGAYMVSWAIGQGCTLSIAQTSAVDIGAIEGMAVTPNGKALVLSEAVGVFCCVDSFSIGPNGALTERGPYYVGGTAAPSGLDITADSQYAIFAGYPNCMYCSDGFLMAFPINPDGSLGTEEDFGGTNGGLGDTWFGFIHLSPNEKYLYASADNGSQIQEVTLNFTEKPLNFSYSGCTTTLRSNPGPDAWSLATAGTSGAGGGLYIAEANKYDGKSAVALLEIDAATGCTTEEPGSPFALSDTNAAAVSLVAWPPRSF